jgi:O-antigen/teichoic acid export membrane protein
LALHVLIVFAGVWLLNLLVHGYVILLVARDQQSLVTRLVVIEAICNAILTLTFVAWFGALGAAVATLVAVAVSNAVILPRMLARVTPVRAREISGLGILYGGLGAVAAGTAGGLGQLVASDVRPFVVFGLAVVLGVGAGFVVLGSGGRIQLQQVLRARRV